MKILPMHSVVLIVGDNPDLRREQLSLFPSHEVICVEAIRRELIGSNQRHGVEEIAGQELHRRVLMKLRLGERVVIDAQNLDRQQRLQLANAGRSMGVPVIYVLAGEVDREVRRGDGLAELFDSRTPYRPVTEMTEADLREKFEGVTAIGDVHGMHQSLLAAIDWARDRSRFIVLIGDVIDYGHDTLECADEVYRLVMRGEAAMILGNHERKIMRWIDGQRVRLSEGNRVTTQALSQLGETNRAKWIGRFRGLYQHGSLVRSISNVTFAHAGVYPGLWKGEEMNRAAENMAYFGETDEVRSIPDRRVPAYTWCESIPQGHYAVVGHDRRAPYPLIVTNPIGGHAVFLDTASGKGGQLSSADFRFTETGMAYQIFKMH